MHDMKSNWTRMDLHDLAAVGPAKQKVSEIADRLRKEEGGGLISIYYHPCEWVHRGFWDGVNFQRGANPPREQWKPPQQRTAEETEGAFRRFADYIDHIRAIPGLWFVTASDLPALYRDPIRKEGVDDEDLLGPDNSPPPSRENAHLSWVAFRDATLDLRRFIAVHQRVPARVFVGVDAVPPADFLLALASAYDYQRKNAKFPIDEGITMGKHLELLPAQRVGKDTPDLFGGWVIHKAGFRAPKILGVARMQAWTLKPALRQ